MSDRETPAEPKPPSVRFKAYLVAEHLLGSEQEFSLELAHQLLEKADSSSKLRPHRCFVQLQPGNSLLVKRRGFGLRRFLPFLITFRQIQRFFVFKQSPCLLFLGSLSLMEVCKRFHVIRFKTTGDINQFCDVLEEAKRREKAVSAESIAATVPEVNNNNNNNEDGSNDYLVHSEKRIKPRGVNTLPLPRQMPKRQSLEVFYQPTYQDQFNNSAPFFLEHGENSSHDPSGLQLLCRSSLTPSQRAPLSSAASDPTHQRGFYSCASLGRSRGPADLKDLLCRQSQRHRLLFEDMRLLSPKLDGCHETKEGPVFFYVAHMAHDDCSQAERGHRSPQASRLVSYSGHNDGDDNDRESGSSVSSSRTLSPQEGSTPRVSDSRDGHSAQPSKSSEEIQDRKKSALHCESGKIRASTEVQYESSDDSSYFSYQNKNFKKEKTSRHGVDNVAVVQSSY